VEASNSCVKTLIFGSFLLLPFVKFFSLAFFRFFDLAFYCLFFNLVFYLWFLSFIAFCQVFFPDLFSLFWLSFLLSFFLIWFFIALCFFLLFRSCFVHVFFSHVVSSLAYPNLLRNKRLGCCCCMTVEYFLPKSFTTSVRRVWCMVFFFRDWCFVYQWSPVSPLI
jgi:hypothetical protein